MIFDPGAGDCETTVVRVHSGTGAIERPVTRSESRTTAGSAAGRRVRNDPVEPRLDVITLAVADLELALAFYRRLGLESKGVVGTRWADERTGANGAIAMFKLEGGLLLNLYPRADLAKDAAIRSGRHKAASQPRATRS